MHEAHRGLRLLLFNTLNVVLHHGRFNFPEQDISWHHFVNLMSGKN